MVNISIKSKADIAKMVEGGKRLAAVKKELGNLVKEGENAASIESLAVKMIKDAGGEPSFMMVPGYSWATCVNVNAGLVHGIPKSDLVFRKGDVVSVDVGMFYKGFHTDTSLTRAIAPSRETEKFLKAGNEALNNAISEAKVGGRIYDISSAIENSVTEAGYTPVKALVGHGVGSSLHEEPKIPCFVSEPREKTPEILSGMTLAIEVMYTQGSSEVEIDNDGWTIRMRDGKISALFEETVAIVKHGPLVLTEV
jgi:methionyl aminopeptidase